MLRGRTYEVVDRSSALPGIDLAQLVSYLDRPTASAAISAHRAALRDG